MRTSRPRTRQASTRLAALVALAVLVTGGCGTQLSHDEIVAFHEGSRVEVASGTPAGADTLIPGDTGAAAPDQGVTDAGAAAGPGSPIPGATPGAATATTAPKTGTATPAAGAGTAPKAGSTGGAATKPAPGTPAPGQPAPAAPAVKGSEIIFGNIGSYSGVLGGIFKGGRESLQAWAQSANSRGGVGGHPVRVTFADDAGDPARALSIARDMVERQKAIGFLGNNMPTSLSGIRKYLEERQVPLIGGDNTLPDWYESPVIFPGGTTVNYVGKAGYALLKAKGETKQAVFFCGESPSCGNLTKQEVEGVELVYKAQISLAQVDFTGECLRARDAGATAVYVAADANTVLRVARSCTQQGYKPRYTTASVAVGPQLVTDPNMEGLVAPVNNFPWFLTDASPATIQYGKAMATYAPGVELSAISAHEWAAGKLLEKIGPSLDADPTSAELLAATAKIRNETLDGLAPALNFNPGRPADQVPCYFAVEIVGGKWTAPNGMTPVC